MKKITKFGLRLKKSHYKNLFGVSTHINIDGSSDRIEYRFDALSDNIWLVNTEEIAEKAKKQTSWYNTDYETPNHRFNAEDLEIVKVTLTYD
jgi:hypothetical protein